MAACPVLLPSEQCSVGQRCADLAPPRPDSFWRDHFRELTALATNRFPCVKPQVVGQTECEGRFRPRSIHRKRCTDARFPITLRPRSISDNRSLTKYDVGSSFSGSTLKAVFKREVSPEVRRLQNLLGEGDHVGFLESFSGGRWLHLAADRDFLRALAGEGLCILLQEKDPSRRLMQRYGDLLLAGLVRAPVETVCDLANRLRSSRLLEVAARLRSKELRSPHSTTKPIEHPDSDQFAPLTPIFQVRRIVQSTFMVPGRMDASDLLSARKSIFRSQQERSFLQALSLRFPGLLALPNYPLDQVADINRLQHQLDDEAWLYVKRCRPAAILVIPDEGDPIAAFDLGQDEIELAATRRFEQMQKCIFQAIGLPLFRFRAESPDSITTDEWYAILTDEVLPKLDTGFRLRKRSVIYGFVPV